MTQSNISKIMAQRPRLTTIELKSNELNYQLKVLATNQRLSVKEMVLRGLAELYPELRELVDQELQ